MIEVTSRRMECTLLTSNYSQMPAVALQPVLLNTKNYLPTVDWAKFGEVYQFCLNFPESCR